MKFLAFAASNNKASINRALIDYAVVRLRNTMMPDAAVTVVDLNDYEMPIYSIDRENAEGVPAQAQSFFELIGDADAILVSFAEHNGFVTAAWKNIFDWMSRIDMKLWQEKPLAMLAATPGGRAGGNVLGSQKLLAPHFGADLRGTHGIGKWPEAWDPDRAMLTRETDIDAIDSLLRNLIAPTRGESAE